jgi:pimeloyl-ACP methyl ester carboxylesterase
VRRALLLGVLAGLGLAAPASAALDFRPCATGLQVQCATLTVPVDRTGAVPGTIPLRIARVAASHPTRPPLVLVTGGPGQEGTALVADGASNGPFPANILHRDIVAFDPRGTGRSGLLRCPALEKAIAGINTDAPATACWNSLGAARFSYTSRTVADDIESIRQALGVPKIALYGISYGTSEVQTYARVYPQGVERLILDSTVPPGGGDGLERESFAAIPRVLSALCIGGRCRAVTSDPIADLAALVHSLPPAGLKGRAVTDAGRHVTVRAGRYELFDLIVNGDFDSTLRGSLPGSVKSALRGDTAPLMRLVRASLKSDQEDFDNPRELSTADFAATVCEEVPFPWPRTATPDQKRAGIAAAAAATPLSSLTPFDRQTLLSPQIVAPCLSWPQSPQPPDLGSSNPNVPALVLSGEADLRTPTEAARAAAAGFPQGVLRTFPYAGHDVIDGFSGPLCAWHLARTFLAGGRVGGCSVREAAPAIAPVAPRSLAKVAPFKPGGRAGRVLHAVGLTIDDAILSPGLSIVPGLRSGRAILGITTLTFQRYVYVPGVTLSGKLTAKRRKLRGTLRVAGKLRGTLRVVKNKVSGTIGGHRVRARIRIAGGHITAVPVAKAAALDVPGARRLHLPRPR